MSDTQPANDRQASWVREGNDSISLIGDWDLLTRNARRRQLFRELSQLKAPGDYRWNLREIAALDSGGAMLLWHIWGRQWPQELVCREEHRGWFERLQQMPSATVDSERPPWSERYAARVAAVANTIGGMLLLAGQLMLDLGYCARHPRVTPWREISANIYRVGATSMPLLGFMGLAIGMVATIQIGLTLGQFGAEQMIVGLVALAVLRELGALISSLIMAGRSGSAMTAGIGAMHITGEIDALRAFGASPTQRLVLPRVLGMVLAMPLLVIWTDFTALVGAAFMSELYLGVSWQLFLVRLPQAVQMINVWIGLVTGVVFGMLIAFVATYFGLTAKPNTESLSHNTTRSVVTSLSLILVIDAISGALLINVGL